MIYVRGALVVVACVLLAFSPSYLIFAKNDMRDRSAVSLAMSLGAIVLLAIAQGIQ